MDSVRSWQRRMRWLEGALYGLGGALFLALAGGFAGSTVPALGLLLFILAPLVLLASLGWFGVHLGMRKTRDDHEVARLIAERVPHVSFDILGALELERELKKNPSFSVELAETFLHHTTIRASVLVDEQDVVGTKRPRRAAKVLAAAVAVCVATVLLAPRQWLAGTRASLVTSEAPTTASRREPITGDIELTYRYPAYTGLAPRTVAGTNGEIAAPAGTEVLLKTRADREVDRADIVVNEKRVPLQINGKRELTGSFVLDKSGTYSISFSNWRGKETARGPDTAIRVEADAPPQVSLQAPVEEELEIDPGQKVTVRFEASDDYGLTSLELIYRPPGKAEEVKVPLKHDEGRRTKGSYGWDVGSIKLSAGDRITYRIEARDNDDVAGKKLGASRTQVLKVYSAAEHRRAAVRKAEQVWEKMVTHLADRLESPDRATDKEPAQISQQQTVDRAGQMLVNELLAVAAELAAQKDNPEELFGALRNIVGGLSARVQQTGDARRLYLRYQRVQPGETTSGRRLTQAVSAEITEVEKDVLYLESLLDHQKLRDLQELGEELMRERRELASLIEQYKQTQDPRLREDILRQISELRQHIDELMQRMGEMAKGIRDEHLNSEALQQLMQDRDVGSALDDVEQLMREGKADEALKKLQELSMQLDNMMKNLDNAGQKMGAEQFPGLSQKLEEFNRELKRAANDQKRVAEETKELHDRYKAKMKERFQKQAQAMKDSMLKQVEQLQSDYKTVSPDSLNASSERPLEEVGSELKNLENALKVDDYDLAAETASRAERAAQDLQQMADQQRRMDEMLDRPADMREQSSKLAEQLERDAEQLSDINRKLQQLFPPPGSMMSEEDRAKLKQLGGEERQLQKRTDGLREQMQEMEEMAPIFGDEGMEQMSQVGERMGQATQKMDGKDPGRAYNEQRAALDQLSQFQQQLQKQQQQQGGKRGSLPMPMLGGRNGNWGGGSAQEKVEIPDADQFQAPKEFRKDILDAMKQGAPDRYREQVKRYYEELVK